MKKKLIKRFFKNCELKFTETTRNGDGSFNYFYKKVEDCLIIVTEGKKTIEYITTLGAELKLHSKRSKSLKFKGTEISYSLFQSILRERKFEVFEMIETIPDPEIKRERMIDYNNFPMIIYKS